jgi:hypothetical protein
VIGGAATSAALAVVGAGLAAGASAKASASGACEVGVCGGATTEAARREEFDRREGQKVGLASGAVASLVTAGVVAAGTATYALVTGRRAGPPRSGLLVLPTSTEW